MGHSTLFTKRCSYAGERPKMAPQVPESAQLAYSIDNPPTTAGVFAVDDQPLWFSTGQPKCCYLLYRGQAADPFFHLSRRLSGSLGVSRRVWGEFCTQQNSIIFGLLRKRCSYAGERPKMAPQVPQSAQLAYSLDNLMVFEPSRAPLEPSGGEPDHFKALICW